MALTQGTHLGPYEIIATLGAGGMGEVYSARDTRLDRTVAIKVSSAQFSDRFAREARAVAALNHPNICTLHDVGPNYLVMEFIDGQTLDRLIPPKGMRPADALRIAIRIADALAAAHRIGLVHRDLKPGNVMVTAEGTVKLLDFGLAAIDETSLPKGDSVATRTVAAVPKTSEGTIVGTYSYMSPEQAEGRKLDARSDIFSFGSLLYEMLTGQRAFRGETPMSTLAAVLNREPKELSVLTAQIPPELQRIVGRCLRKAPDRRFQHAADLRVELQEIADTQSSGSLVATPAVLRRVPGYRGWAPLAIAAALIAGIAVGWVLHRSPPPFRGPKLTRATYDSGLTCDAALSPDGKLLAYASDRAGKGNLDIWVQPVNGGDAVQLTRDEADESQPSFSPDGSQLAYRSERDRGGIYVIGALGGQPRLVAREGRTPRFSPDGKQIAYWTGRGGRSEDFAQQGGRIFVIPAGGGEPRQLGVGRGYAGFPVWSPDGREILFTARAPNLPFLHFNWYVTPVEQDHPVATNASEILGPQVPPPSQWLPSNEVVFALQRPDGANLYRVGLDPRTAKVSGLQQLTFGSGLEDAPSVAAGGLIAMSDLVWNYNIWSLPVEADTARITGDPIRLTDSLLPETRPTISADGRKMAYVRSHPNQISIWVRDFASGSSTPLASFSTNVSSPFLNADGSLLVYSLPRDEVRTLFTMPTTGGRGNRLLDNAGIPQSWTRSGKIVHRTNPAPAKVRFALLDPQTRADRAFLETEKPSYQASFSPDETRITFIFLPTPQTTQLFVAPATGAWPVPRSEWLPVTDGTGWEDKPVWSPNGNLLYFTSERDGYRCIWARRMDPKTHRTGGEVFPVYHLHSSRRSMSNISLSMLEMGLAPNRIVFAQGEVNGNVWLVKTQ